MRDFNEILVGAITVILMVAISTVFFTLWGFVWAFPLTWSWNYVMPPIFGLKKITYWQMFCLYLILTSLWKSTLSTTTKR